MGSNFGVGVPFVCVARVGSGLTGTVVPTWTSVNDVVDNQLTWRSNGFSAPVIWKFMPPFVQSWSDATNNLPGKHSSITFVFDGTSWVQTAYTSWC